MYQSNLMSEGSINLIFDKEQIKKGSVKTIILIIIIM